MFVFVFVSVLIEFVQVVLDVVAGWTFSFVFDVCLFLFCTCVVVRRVGCCIMSDPE